METLVRSLPEAVYRAEWRTLDPVARRFPTMAALQSYVDHLTMSEWWDEHFPAARDRHPVVEARSSSARFSVCSGDVIAIINSPTGRTMSTVLHELAHYATASADGHGPIFRNAMIKLVRHEMGIYAAVELEQAYREEMTL